MANEKRLIDANALMDTCRATLMGDIFPNWQNMTNTEKNIATKLGGAFKRIHENAPTVDAVEVVHGRWISKQIAAHDPFGYYTHEVDVFTCSVCGVQFDVSECRNYCPNCGAKMDGERKDNEKVNEI